MGRWRNDTRRYGLPSRPCHWTTAALIAASVALGFHSTTLRHDTGPREQILALHKSLGLTILGVTILRLSWVAWTPGRLDRLRLKPSEATVAHMDHASLYAVLLAMPLSGILMSLGSGRDISLFGVLHLPHVLPIDPTLPPRAQHFYRLGKTLHDSVLQWALYAIFAIHMVGVVKH